VALASAQALRTLLADVSLGRDERVDPVLLGRLSPAAAFPPKLDFLPLLDSPYPPVRAAALRVLLGQGGKVAAEARARTDGASAVAVSQVRQQLLFKPRPQPEIRKQFPLLLPPKDPAELQAACAKMVEELPGLEKKSAWEEMTRRAESLA